MKIDFKLVRRIGTISESRTGYTKEFNIVLWDEQYKKYDLRTWDSGGKPGKGVTMTKEELQKLYELIGAELERHKGEAL